MTRNEALEQIWRETHRDFKGMLNGVRCILVCRGGVTRTVALDNLTDAEIAARVKGYKYE